ncbi:MAG: TonB-dependent receptor [Candidatus Marinimicrobia bacterium]|nr:TonB-dependent receptor [Candidatus Neomarinimicrobiota bacterium]
MNKRQNARFILSLFLVILLPMSIFAGETGKITGTVVDKENGNPLPGVNVVLEGTSYGAASDMNGDFMILFIPSGLYNIKLSFIGYAVITIENVRVTSDLTTNLFQIDMSSEAIEGQAVTVFAEKALIELTATNEVRVIRAEDIKNMAVRGYANVAALQTGVVTDAAGNLHIRGGRTDEVGFYVDGVYVNNSYTLGRSGDVPNLSLEEVAFQSGGFGAEYGSANAGIVSTTTKTGGSAIEGTFESISDGFGTGTPSEEKPFVYSYGYNLLSGAFGGPVPGLSWLRYFGSIEQTSMLDADPSGGRVPYYEGKLNPLNGRPDNGEAFTDLNGNTVWDSEPFKDANNNGILDTDEAFTDVNKDGHYSYEPFVDANNNSIFDGSDYINVDPKDFAYKYGPKPNNGQDRISFAGNLLIDFQPLIGQAWKLKIGGSTYKDNRSNYSHVRSLFNFYNTASTGDGIGTTGKLENRFLQTESFFNSFYTRLSGNVPGLEKMFFSAQYSRSNEGYMQFDPVFEEGAGGWVWEDGTVSDSKLPHIQVGKVYDNFNPTWTYSDTAGIRANYNYWQSDSNLTFVQIDYDTVWINPLYRGIGSEPAALQQLANYNLAGEAYASYVKRRTARNSFKGSLTWQAGSHEIKVGGEYSKNNIRYYRIGTGNSLTTYFLRSNQAYSPDQDIYTWDQTLNDSVGAMVRDFVGDGVADYLQDPNDAWENTDRNGDGTANHDDYFDEYTYQAYSSAYAENIGYDVTGQYEVNSGQDAAREPVIGAFYAQDKFEIQDMILNLGFRYDYIDPANLIYNPETGGRNNIVLTSVNTIAETVYAKDLNSNGELDPSEYKYDEPTAEDAVGKPHRIPSEVRSLVSPRVGLAFPITDKTVFHATYGKYFQQPELNRMYSSYTRFVQNMTQGNFTQNSNPDLQPVENTQYEVGVKQMLSQDISIDISVFYKQMSGYIQLRNVAASPRGYALFVNGDFGTVKGLSLAFKTRRINNIMFDFNYTLQYAGGTGSSADGLYRIAWQDGNNPTYVAPLDFDQRHTGSFMVDYRTGRRSFISDAGVNLLLRVGSGLPYTPVQISSEVIGGNIYYPRGGFNSSNMPWRVNLDMKIDKSFALGGVSFNAFVWILNALDLQNVLDVYPGTGSPDNDGYLETEGGQSFLSNFVVGGVEEGTALYNSYNEDPGNFDVPRQVRVGIRVDF